MIEAHTNGELDLRTYRVSGVVTADEIRRAVEEYYSGQVTSRVLWDFSEADLRSVTMDDIRSLVVLSRRHAAQRPGGRTALVFGSMDAYGLGRVFQILQELEETVVEHGVFREQAEALEFLGLDAAPDGP